jgi:tetratricopeptide (TPR) repeat protein
MINAASNAIFRTVTFLITASLAASLAAQHQHETSPLPVPLVTDLGEVDFPNSGSPEAQPYFLRGILLLHSFEYRPAADAFREARRIDPSFALAYWGEAMTHNHPIWGEQDTAAGRKVLELLGSTEAERQAKAPTEREKGYLGALELLLGAGDKRSRDAAYSEAMERLSVSFPDDLDAKAFYALSLLGLSGEIRDIANYMKAAAVAEEVYEVNRRHPGALHYLIHAYDDPLHAPLGLRAARLYASVAPAASHAQHMPSHIFYALGIWDEAISSNIDSLNTARSQGMGGYHPMHWLQHGWLQVGRQAEAERLLMLVGSDVEKNPTPFARTHQAMMGATWLIETRGSRPDIAVKPVDDGGIASLAPFASLDFARGLIAAESGDAEAAGTHLSLLRGRLDDGRKALRGDDAIASRYSAVYPAEIASTEIMEKMLESAIAFAAGKPDAAIRLARAATEMEDRAEFEYGPPPTLKPPYELLGELLLRSGQKAEAIRAFESVLKRYPNRRLTLEGLRAAGVEVAIPVSRMSTERVAIHE